MPASIKRTITAGASVCVIVSAAYFIAPFEGERFKAYPDTGGIWTICYGHTSGVKAGDTATHAECIEYLEDDVTAAEAILSASVDIPVPNNIHVAELSFIFNCGAKDFLNSTLRKKTNAGDFTGACAEFIKFANIKVVKGSVADMRDGRKDGLADCSIAANKCTGLYFRRNKEKELCLDKIPYDHYSVAGDGSFVGVRLP